MVELLDDARRIAAALPPLRRQILEHVRREPASAAGIARALKLPRQRVHYHVGKLAKAGFLEAGEKRQRRGFTEQVFRPAARSYVIDPGLLGGAMPEDARDRFSSAYLLATAGRVAREVSDLRKGAAKARKRLPTFTLETEVRFASAADRAAFAEELSAAVGKLIARYHDAKAPGGRAFRFVVTGHPARKEAPS